MDALSKQLDTLRTIVPEEKETDEFIRLLQVRRPLRMVFGHPALESVDRGGEGQQLFRNAV